MDKKGGRFQISAAADGVGHNQVYWPSTNLLVTRFLLGDGIAELEDFMPVVLPRDYFPLARDLGTIPRGAPNRFNSEGLSESNTPHCGGVVRSAR